MRSFSHIDGIGCAMPTSIAKILHLHRSETTPSTQVGLQWGGRYTPERHRLCEGSFKLLYHLSTRSPHAQSQLRAGLDLHPQVFVPHPFPQRCSLLSHCGLTYRYIFPRASKCLDVFGFGKRAEGRAGEMLPERSAWEAFAFQLLVAPADSSIKKVVFQCSRKAVIFLHRF